MKRPREDGIGGPGKRPGSASNRGGPPPQNSSSRLTTHDALSYLRDVKEKFSDNKDIYDTFLEIMKEFKAQRINTEGVIERVKSLFKGHRELILGFNTFLPKGYEITLPPEEEPQKAAVEFDQAINYVNKIKTRFSSDERVYKAFLEILNMYRKGTKTIGNVYEEVALLFRSHNDLLEEFTYFLPDSTTPQPMRGWDEQAPAAMRRPGGRTGRGPTSRGMAAGYPGDHLMRKNIRKGSRMDLYTSRMDDVDERRSTAAKGDFAKEFNYFEKVKGRIRSREQYQDFLKTLNLYAQEIISRTELHAMIYDILGRSNDLMLGFHEFLNKCETMDAEPDIRLPHGKLSARDMAKLKQAYTQTDKYISRPISELDVTGWQRCSTSYVHLPDNYPKLGTKHQTKLGDIVLQDDWVSVTSGSEDYSFKHMRKNQYEEALFRCEDDRFELDMAIERNASTIRAMQPLVEVIQALPENGDERAAYRPAPGALGPIHLRNISSIYGEQGAQVRELLEANPVVAIPVVMFRLQQKDREWRAVKESMAVVWQRIYESNYHKSLDHRSFYFKQTDKRNLGAKAMLSEIRDIVEKRKAADGTADAPAAAPAIAPPTPDLQLPYNDRAVHDDVFQVMKYSLEESLAADVAQKCLDFWYAFVEPFFGLPPRPKEAAIKVDKEGPTSPGGVKKMMHLDALSGELDNDMDGGLDSEMPSAEAGGETANLDTHGEVASALGVLTGAAKAVADAGGMKSAEATPPPSLPMDDVDGDDTSAEGNSARPSEAACAHCKPLAPAPHVHSSQGKVPGTGRVLCGHDAFYIFLRLHHHLYERLWRARKCALEKERQGGGFGSGGPETEVGGNCALQALEGNAATTHANFMRLLYDLIDGNHDASAYEDACRALLGTNSYVLFTLDKLIYKMVKQTQLLMTDELALKLLDLYRYEAARTVLHVDAVYRANARILLHDEPMFQCTSCGDGMLTLQLIESDGNEGAPGVMEPGFADYLQQYTGSQAEASLDSKALRLPFMRRLLPVPRAWEDPTTEDARVLASLSDTYVANGLECKLSCSSSKALSLPQVSYVLDTEDVFCRMQKKIRKNNVDELESKRRARFGLWLDALEVRPREPAAAPPAAAWMTSYA